MASTPDRSADTRRLHELTRQLLIKDVDAHEAALEELAELGDNRVVPHLVELTALDTVANNWPELGFPEIFRDKQPPYALTHPEVRWPGVNATLCELAEPEYRHERVAWLQWEHWYNQQGHIEPLDGFFDWKVELYRSYYPEVGHLLDTDPKHEDLDRIRWGACDRSVLHPLNAPTFLPASEATYLEDEDLIYGFVVDGQPYAVPRYLLFPHEMLNAKLEGVPLCLSYCTMCNSPILYNRRVGDTTYQFGNSGFTWNGNKAMYDEETMSLWNQQAGVPIAGEMLERYRESAFRLNFLPVTQAPWTEWADEHPDTRVLNRNTGYEYEYGFYRDYDGFIKTEYWDNPDILHPGITPEDGGLDEKEYVYGVEGDDGGHVYPVQAIEQNEPVTDTIDGDDVVVVTESSDVAIYQAPPLPIERRGDVLVDANGTQWRIEHDGLVTEQETKDRITGRHGLWLSFRPHYDEFVIVTGTDESD